MISDLLKLRQELRSAEAGAAQAGKSARFQARIETEIAGLFADPKFPQRRRSFGQIRGRFGPVFEGRDSELGQILIDMGAHVHKGSGDDALWEFSRDDHAAWSQRATARRPFSWYRLGSALLIAALALVGLDLLLRALGLPGLVPSMQAALMPGGTHADCIANANGIFTEIQSCHREFGLLQRSP